MTTAPQYQTVDLDRENTIQVLRTLLAGGNIDICPPCGNDQRKIDRLRDLCTRIPSANRQKVMQVEIRMLLEQDPALAVLMEEGNTQKNSTRAKLSELASICPSLPENCLIPDDVSCVCPELDSVVAYASRIAHRSYEGFFPFAAIYMFSVLLAGRPVLNLRGKQFRTNVYFAFCADSSLDAKSFIVEYVIKPLLESAGVLHLMGGGGHNTSPEKFISNLAGRYIPENWEELSKEEQLWKESILAFCAQRGLYFDEFGEFVEAIFRPGSTLAKYASILLQLFDCPKVFDGSDTIGRGAELVYNACITILASMTIPDIVQHAYAGSKLWRKGFWSRFLFIVADPVQVETVRKRFEQGRKQKDFSTPDDLTEAMKACHKRLGIPYCEVKIERVSDQGIEQTGKKKPEKIKRGIDREEFPRVVYTISNKAESAWDRYSEALQLLCLGLPEDLRGSYVRLPETAMRIALILASVSDSENRRVVEFQHWAKAQELAELLRANLHKLYNKVSTPVESPLKKLESKILSFLREHPTEWFTSREIQRKCHEVSKVIKPLLSDLLSDGEIIFDLEGTLGKPKSYRIAEEVKA